MRYTADFQLVQMERKVARAAGHRSRDETEALSGRIRELEGALAVAAAEQGMLGDEVKRAEEDYGGWRCKGWVDWRCGCDAGAAVRPTVASQFFILFFLFLMLMEIDFPGVTVSAYCSAMPSPCLPAACCSPGAAPQPGRAGGAGGHCR